MGLLDQLFTRQVETGERRGNLSLTNYAQWVELGLSGQTASGVSITPETALKNTAVFACVRILSETVASLPLFVYERLDQGKRRAEEHYLYQILHDRPNDLMTSFEFRETIQAHLALWGNGYAEIEYDGTGRVRQLWPLRPDKILQTGKTPDGMRAYQYQLPDNAIVWIPADRIWHLRGLGADGLQGYSPISLMRQAVGLGLAAEEFGARFFGNDARPGGVLQHPGILSEEAHGRLRESWESSHGGLSKSHRVAILEEGLTYQQIGIPPEDAQFLETRRFQVQEIARMYRVPPHMLADLERATFSNIEHQSIDFVVHTIRPWLVRWEQSISQNLMLAKEQRRYFAEFLVDGLLRGDIKSRYEAYSIGRQNGWLSADDIREFENMNPLDEGGDVYLIPMNMIPVGGSAAPAQEEQPEENGQRSLPMPEDRQRDVGLRRQQLIGSHLPLFEDAVARFVRREVSDVKRQARKMLKRDQLADFLLWLEEFYEEHRGFVEKAMKPTLIAYASAVIRAVQNEIKQEGDVPAESFIDEYLQLYSLRYTHKQVMYLTDLIRRTQEEEGDVLEAVEQRMDEWDEIRPEQEARREAHRSNNAIAILAYAALGVTVKRWVTIGDTCPWCKQLNGRVVEVHTYFLQVGEALEGGDGRPPLQISANMGHPPAHDGCDCMVIAGV